MMHRLLIIPAAGLGSRLGASKPKPLVEVNGRPMLSHLEDLYRPFVDDIVVVANPASSADIVEWGRHSKRISVTEQLSPTGMLDAILLAAPFVRDKEPAEIWITWSDQVGVLPARSSGSRPRPPPRPGRPSRCRPSRACTRTSISSATPPDGSAASSSAAKAMRCRQEGESDMGLFAMTRETFELDLPEYARDVPPGAATGERNFLPFIPWLAQRTTVATFPCTDPMEAIGINTPDELRQVEAWLRSRA